MGLVGTAQECGVVNRIFGAEQLRALREVVRRALRPRSKLALGGHLRGVLEHLL